VIKESLVSLHFKLSTLKEGLTKAEIMPHQATAQ